MITVDGITKKYGKKSVPALDHVNIEIPSGVYGILGRNGAGKTTLLRIMASALAPTEGKILVDGTPIGKNIRAFRRKLGFLPQNTKLMPELNIVEFLEYMCILKGIKKKETIHSEIERLLVISGLSDERKKKLKAYSGGMLRRAGIAQALIGDPKILIVDEPTTGLDPEERLYFINLISRIGSEKTVILSTHITHDIESVCQNVCFLEKGIVKYSGKTKEAVKSVENSVWSVQIQPCEEAKIREKAILTRETYEEGKLTVRYIANESIYENSVNVKATLEDAFIFSVGGISR